MAVTLFPETREIFSVVKVIILSDLLDSSGIAIRLPDRLITSDSIDFFRVNSISKFLQPLY